MTEWSLIKGMARLAVETCAILRATMPQVRARQPEIMMRMWHVLPESFDRDLLFASYERPGTGPSLIEAVLDALPGLETGRDFQPRPALAMELCIGREALQRAFLKALAEMLGTRATEMVMNAWRQLLAVFFRESCQG